MNRHAERGRQLGEKGQCHIGMQLEHLTKGLCKALKILFLDTESICTGIEEHPIRYNFVEQKPALRHQLWFVILVKGVERFNSFVKEHNLLFGLSNSHRNDYITEVMTCRNFALRAEPDT